MLMLVSWRVIHAWKLHCPLTVLFIATCSTLRSVMHCFSFINFFFYLCLQNGPLPFSKFEFLVAWILREVLSIWMTIQSHRTSIVQWRHKKYRVLWGGTIEEFVWFLSCQEERTRTREFRSPSASHFLVENCCHGLGILYCSVNSCHETSEENFFFKKNYQAISQYFLWCIQSVNQSFSFFK